MKNASLEGIEVNAAGSNFTSGVHSVPVRSGVSGQVAAVGSDSKINREGEIPVGVLDSECGVFIRS